VITGASAGTLTPGATGTVTGQNFGQTAGDNELFVGGARAVITSASPTSVSFTVPAALDLPCTPTGPVQIRLITNGDTAVTTMPLQMATSRTLAVGQSLLLTSEADLFCNEFNGTGGRYLITAFNYASFVGARSSFQLLGAGAEAGIAAGAERKAQSVASAFPPQEALPEHPLARYERAHLSLMQQDRALVRPLGNPGVGQRIQRRRGGAAALNVVPDPPPAVGDLKTFRIRRTLNSLNEYDEVSFRVVYVGPKLIMYEDVNAPAAGTINHLYQLMGTEFDQAMFPMLLNFGNPVVVDSALDNNGRIIALFTKRVNDYVVNGQTNLVLGFVSLCDYFPRTPLTLPDGRTVSACPASNEGEVFYAMVPDPNAAQNPIPADVWRRFMRGTLIHEAKHITAYSERYYREANVEDLEEIWLEEATAQQASEIWARSLYGRPQKGDIVWSDGPFCDYAPMGGGCTDPAEGILHHFSFLYRHYNANESKSILDNQDAVIYGSTWSFARWVTDIFGGDEGVFLRSLVQVQNDHGIPNIVSKSGREWHELLGLWSLATLADNYPGATINDQRLQLPSWNTRNMFNEMNRNAFLASSFPRAWPLNVRQVLYGNFPTSQSLVSLLPGGGFAAWELSGVQSGPQVLAIRSTSGGLPPPLVGMAIVRIQ
jgi:hypothetical protein